jgi:hypothetical protein
LWLFWVIVLSVVLLAVAAQTASAFGISLKTTRRGFVRPAVPRRHGWIRSSAFSTSTTLCYNYNRDRIEYTKPWFEEDPALSKEMEAAETRYWNERAECDARYRQVLDRVCALSSPRVAFERRIDHLARTGTRQWGIPYGMIADKSDYEDSERFGYAFGTEGFYVFHGDEDEYFSQDHGNFVEDDIVEGDFRHRSQWVYLHVLPDPESLTVEELKKELEKRDLSQSGEKSELVARLQKLKKKVEE